MTLNDRNLITTLP